MVMHASGGLLYGREVERPKWFPKKVSAWKNRIVVRREEVRRRLMLGERVDDIAKAIAEPRAAIYQDAHKIYREAGVRDWREYVRKVGKGEKAVMKRERVEELMREGLRTREIAERLGLSMKAVGLHRMHLYKKAGVHSWGEWVARCGVARGS